MCSWDDLLHTLAGDEPAAVKTASIRYYLIENPTLAHEVVKKLLHSEQASVLNALGSMAVASFKAKVPIDVIVDIALGLTPKFGPGRTVLLLSTYPDYDDTWNSEGTFMELGALYDDDASVYELSHLLENGTVDTLNPPLYVAQRYFVFVLVHGRNLTGAAADLLTSQDENYVTVQTEYVPYMPSILPDVHDIATIMPGLLLTEESKANLLARIQGGEPPRTVAGVKHRPAAESS